MSNSQKKEQPHWLRHPKTQQEKKQAESAKDQDVPVRGKRSKQNLPDLYDDNPVSSNLKKQNKDKKPSRDTIRKGEEDEQSISKQMKKTGKATFKGPQVKERKHFAPATKVETPKKGKGSYNRQSFAEDEQDYSRYGTVPLRREDKPKNRIQQMDSDMKRSKAMRENTNIKKFIDSILTKNYAAADKYIKQAVECKIQSKIEQELTTPLFQ